VRQAGRRQSASSSLINNMAPALTQVQHRRMPRAAAGVEARLMLVHAAGVGRKSHGMVYRMSRNGGHRFEIDGSSVTSKPRQPGIPPVTTK